MRFQFHIYDADAVQIDTQCCEFDSVKAAKAKAMRLSKKHGGPVDLAYGDDSDWNDRYITTAIATHLPHWDVPVSAGGRRDQGWAFTFERLD